MRASRAIERGPGDHRDHPFFATGETRAECGRQRRRAIPEPQNGPDHRGREPPRRVGGVYEYEHDQQVLEFYDQPPAIKLIYQAKNGRQVGVWHTPDYFVLRADGIG